MRLARPPIATAVRQLFGAAETLPENARFQVDGGERLGVVPSRDGHAVDPESIRSALEANPALREVPVRIANVKPTFSTADAQHLGPVSHRPRRAHRSGGYSKTPDRRWYGSVISGPACGNGVAAPTPAASPSRPTPTSARPPQRAEPPNVFRALHYLPPSVERQSHAGHQISRPLPQASQVNSVRSLYICKEANGPKSATLYQPVTLIHPHCNLASIQ